MTMPRRMFLDHREFSCRSLITGNAAELSFSDTSIPCDALRGTADLANMPQKCQSLVTVLVTHFLTCHSPQHVRVVIRQHLPRTLSLSTVDNNNRQLPAG